MGAKKGGNRVSEDAEEDLARAPLQAILLADSFAQTYFPITLERPKVLLPVVNVPMIDYTLAWLESAGVEEVFVFCCANAKQVVGYLDSCKWLVGLPKFSVTTIESHNCVSAGDALRVIYERNVIHGDFVLISGDTVSNMDLNEALKEHKDRRKKDSNAVMTMVIKRSKPNPISHQSRLGTDELFMAIDPVTKQLLHYEDKPVNSRKTIISLDKTILADNPSVFLHNDKQDCYIDICSAEVLSLFTDNFDYQHLRRHFVKGLLVDDIMGYKIFTHEIQSSYAARIDNFRSYDTISKDVIQRWTYPFVPDVQFSDNSALKLDRQGMYRSTTVGQSRSAKIGSSTVIGNRTSIGDNTVISNSVIGDDCVIGSNVAIEGCYIWKNVTIEDGCKLSHAIVCDGVIIKSGAVLEPGVVLSFKVVVGQNFVVPSHSKASLLQQPNKQDSDEELEYPDNSSEIIKIQPITSNGILSNNFSDASELGIGGNGFIWSVSEGNREEELRHSVAPIPSAKLAELFNQSEEPDVEITPDYDPIPNKGPDSPQDTSDDEHLTDDSLEFEKEVDGTFLRAVEENVKVEHVVLEVNSLRLSCNMTSVDCASALFYSMMKYALDLPHSSPSELVKNASNVLTKWLKLLKYYLPSIDEEIEVIMKLEEMCLESAKEYSSLFVQILHLLYDKDITQEEAILRWAAEKEGADESDKVFLKQSEQFIQWLNDASEEED
jgi:translation initiation factor eIF-2B subunit epsilon